MLKQNTDKLEMRSYLLGSLSLDRRAEFEERMLRDRELYQELLVTEDELIDEYVAGSLSKPEQHRFETHFLITAERQTKLRFGKVFSRYLNSRPVDTSQEERPLQGSENTQKQGGPRKSSPFFLGPFVRNPALALAIIVVSLGITAVCWLVISRQRELQPTRTLVVALASGSPRSGGGLQRLSTPSPETEVRLELELAATEFKKYQAELFRELVKLETFVELKLETQGSRHFIPVTVAGKTLTSGDYQIKLSGISDSGQSELIGSYSLRVTPN